MNPSEEPVNRNTVVWTVYQTDSHHGDFTLVSVHLINTKLMNLIPRINRISLESP